MYEMDHVCSVRLVAFVFGNILVKTKGKGCIYIMPHSWHDDKAVAIDHKSIIYMSEGHFCGGSDVYQAFHFKVLKHTDDFFKHFVIGDINGDLHRVK
jgi:hypothetical protein